MYRHSGEGRKRSEAFSAIQADSRSWFFLMPDQVRYDGELGTIKLIRKQPDILDNLKFSSHLRSFIIILTVLSSHKSLRSIINDFFVSSFRRRPSTK
jgi:hypothetical protein